MLTIAVLAHTNAFALCDLSRRGFCLVDHKMPKRKANDSLVVAAALDSGTAVSAVLASLSSNHQLAQSVTSARKDASTLLYELPNTETPFGTLCKESVVRGKKGSTDVYHVNPAAFLYHALQSLPFRMLLHSWQAASPARNLTIAVYLDEATPGNQRRPDCGRSSQCIYWTILEFPKWFLSRCCGWLPFAYVLVSELKRVALDDSMLVRFVLREFLKESFDGCDFAINIPGGSGGDYVFRFTLKLQIADWPQHKKTFNLKGFNGSVCCYWCANCLGRCRYFEDPILVHFSSTESHRFVRHTYDSIVDVVTRLEHTYRHDKRALSAEQQSTGYKYDPDGLMWDPEARSRLRLPEAAYIDWMHTLMASGGVAQYQLNQLVLALGDHGVDIDSIDEWFSSVKVPAGFTKLKKTFFRNRVVNQRTSHIRAFANEMLSAIVIMGLFLDVVVVPLQIAALAEHIECFTLLICLTAILQKADIRDIPDFRTGVNSHRVLFLQLYRQCYKTKGHALSHVADSWEYWRVLLSCFSPERYHRTMKAVMSFSYRRPTKTTLAYAVRTWFRNLQGEHALEPVHFVDTIYHVHGVPAIPCANLGPAVITQWCKKIACRSVCLQ